jgi:hypothetical protein
MGWPGGGGGFREILIGRDRGARSDGPIRAVRAHPPTGISPIFAPQRLACALYRARAMVRAHVAWLPLRRPFALACASALAVLVACGGRQVGDEARDGGTTTLPDGAVCVDIDLSSYDQSCTTDSDCAVVTSGQLCAKYCPCGGSTINESQLGRYRAAVADVPTGECSCGSAGPPSCVGGTCLFCSTTPGNDGLPACPSDAGASDASTGSDAGG